MKKLSLIMVVLFLSSIFISSCGINDSIQQTNLELNLSIYDLFDYDALIELYKEKYPNVKVNINTIDHNQISYSDYVMKLVTEIMSGNGPDIIFIDSTFMKEADTYKMAYAGAFADMEPYFNGFFTNEYNENIMSSGVLGGKRYLIPISYNVPVFLTSKEILNETALNLSEKMNFLSLMENSIEASENAGIAVFSRENSIDDFMYLLGLNIVDYEHKRVDLSYNELEKATSLYKSIYDANNDGVISYNLFNGCYGLINHNMIFENYGTTLSFSIFFLNSMAVNAVDEPVFVPVYNSNGGIEARITSAIAINRSSANQENASNFIKLALSDNWQGDIINNPAYSIPVNNNTVKKLLSEYQVDMSTGEWIPDGVKLEGLSTEYCNKYFTMLNDIESAYYKAPWSDMFQDEMLPYYNGNSSYDICLKNIKDKLEIYIEE